MECFGAGGGVPARASNSTIGRMSSLISYCFASATARSSGIQVPAGHECNLLDESYFQGHCDILVALTLTLSVSTLHLLMDPFLHLSLQDPGSLRLVEIRDLEQLCRIQPSVILPSHHQLFANDQFVYRPASYQK